MDKKARFMEAVAQKVGKRTPMMRRKGKPGMAVMIAIGAPKAGMTPPMKDEDEGESMGEQMPKAKKIAMLQEKIAALKAELALLEDEDEMDDEGEMEEAEDEESED